MDTELNQSEKKIILVIAYSSEKELARFQTIFDHWNKFIDPGNYYEVLISTTIDKFPITTIPFKIIKHVDPKNTKPQKCVSIQWLEIAKHIEKNEECDCWFWWEWDVVTTQSDAFKFLLEKWNSNLKIMGFHIQDNLWNMKNRINGSAIYSKYYWSYVCLHSSNLLTFEHCTFDHLVVYENHNSSDFLPINKWYALIHHEGKIMLTREVRIAHGVRDDSLLNFVLQRNSIYRIYPCFVKYWQYFIKSNLRNILMKLIEQNSFKLLFVYFFKR